MSKRPFYPQQHGDRKKAKLDVTISDHNFPLSQNGPNKDANQDNWGDDNDDEILLLASQACEDAYNDISSLPDYSLCMHPGTTSTQNFDPGPSSSKKTFLFKKPTSAAPTSITTRLADKCDRISFPLHGMSPKVISNTRQSIDLTGDDLIINDKIFKEQDSSNIYKQFLLLQEENAKLKSENGKLLEKCVTKEGEASILRTQLKSCQVSVDNARMEKIKAQEKVQLEWTDKLNNVNGQMHDLRTQLDFKNLEIISIKERCRMLESNKVKLTQVMVANNDISNSQRLNGSFSSRDHHIPHTRKPNMASSSAQTDDKAHFLTLNKTRRPEQSNLASILPIILEPTSEQHSLLDNDKLQKQTDLTQQRCRIYSTFHRITTLGNHTKSSEVTISMAALYNDVVKIAAKEDGDSFANMLQTVYKCVEQTVSELQQLEQFARSAFHRHSDEKYLAADTHVDSGGILLLSGRALYKQEQAILSRRMVATLTCILQHSPHCITQTEIQTIISLVERITTLLDATTSAIHYSGLLSSIIKLLIITYKHSDRTIISIVKNIISSRPLPFVCCELLELIKVMSAEMLSDLVKALCPKSSLGDLKLDYDQGVLLYKKDSCHIQVLLKQVEASLKCMEKQRLSTEATRTTALLIMTYCSVSKAGDKDNNSCECQQMFIQVIVYALSICGDLIDFTQNERSRTRLLSVCRAGVQLLYRCSLKDSEFGSQLASAEGHLIRYCERVRLVMPNDAYASMLSEVSCSSQCGSETSGSTPAAAWTQSFRDFHIHD